MPFMESVAAAHSEWEENSHFSLFNVGQRLDNSEWCQNDIVIDIGQEPVWTIWIEVPSIESATNHLN